ncbi:alpha/beta hydrolase [Hymenobacter sp. H14-R3]|uniref:alpha/beta hydrolase n=1 Tax=Hymenobacter sp. H14-R3 TaxID=3046308 RepID=UPI0024BAB4C7|nr:alpha/beta hydrolase [Hymenobacter sp. H14-R3]MDJ0366172.1 alpha/beta hydrolase [Hymenobacter sp. H14-R3]
MSAISLSTAVFQPLTYVYQPAPTPARATLLLLHGTGGDERDLLAIAARFGPGLNVLSLRGNVQEGGMPRFFRRLGMGVFDEPDVIFRTHELADFLGKVAVKEGFDATKLIAVGYSNGANIAGGLLMLYPGLLAGAVLWRPMQPLVQQVPVFAAPRPVPVFFTPGQQDPTVRPAATNAYAALLTRAGYVLTRRDMPTGHNLVPADLDGAVAWLEANFPAV